ncbi:hypothetical protein DAPPUDRAFT_242317 [Daphnia pulex]|uniref:Uncharacterized protein n=1 Tax=Daphnia pulex TaxID=6669 RepID=E9GGD5_DAPPU|nr:hypothetical protein DAPPUDRAFT_242317 [Daphnia pulex]|eukprot:EFX81383.1 hypothetical protein DAPPUDRAFT_242317 [Daphnia pulex]
MRAVGSKKNGQSSCITEYMPLYMNQKIENESYYAMPMVEEKSSNVDDLAFNKKLMLRSQSPIRVNRVNGDRTSRQQQSTDDYTLHVDAGDHDVNLVNTSTDQRIQAPVFRGAVEAMNPAELETPLPDMTTTFSVLESGRTMAFHQLFQASVYTTTTGNSDPTPIIIQHNS